MPSVSTLMRVCGEPLRNTPDDRSVVFSVTPVAVLMVAAVCVAVL